MTELDVGDKAPDFCLPDKDGEVLCLKELEGEHVVLYFYPRDGTPGCTRQAKELSAMLPEFEKRGAIVVGVNPDSQESHRKFAEKNGLTVRLLSDEDNSVVESYGVWKMKKMYGKEFLGVVRSTFMIGPDGIIKAVWPKVKVPGHVEEVLAKLDEIREEMV